VLAAAPREFVERTEHQAIILINVGAALFVLEVGVKLRRTGVQIAASIVKRLGPREGTEKLEAASQATLVLRLQRIVGGISAVVLDRDGAELREAYVGWIGIWQVKKILICIVVTRQILAAISNVCEADRAVGAELPLNLQVPLADVRSDVRRKYGNHGNAAWVGQIKIGEVAAGQSACRLRCIQLALRTSRLARQRTGKSDAKALSITDGVLSAERRVLRKLIADAPAIKEVKDPIAAAKHGLAVVREAIGKANARAEIVVVVVDEAARKAIFVGEVDRAGGHIKVRLAILHFDWLGVGVVAQAEVQREPRRDPPIVLGKEAVLPAARADSSTPASSLRLPASAPVPSLAPEPLLVEVPSYSSLSSSTGPPLEVAV